jgi:uncharacterized membrane protein
MDGGFHPLLGLLCLIVLGVAIGLVVGWFNRRRTPAAAGAAAPMAHTMATPVSPTANAEAILAERLARSELSPDDYRTMLATLREANPPA